MCEFVIRGLRAIKKYVEYSLAFRIKPTQIVTTRLTRSSHRLLSRTNKYWWDKSCDIFDSIWFKGKIPKHAFIAWDTTRHRLHTRDILIRWGLHVSSMCLLCNSHDEFKQHLFFDDYSFAVEVWSYFTSRAHVPPPKGVRWYKIRAETRIWIWFFY